MTRRRWNRSGRRRLVRSGAALGVVAAAFAVPAAPASALPVGTYAYFANTQDGTLTALDTATGTVAARIPVGDDPQAVAVSANGQRVYVANFASGTVSVVDAVNNSVIDTIALPDTGTGHGLVEPYELALSQNGSRLYVTDFGQDELFVIDTSSDAVTATIPVGSTPTAVVVTPTQIYVANYGSGTVEGTVSVVDPVSQSVTKTLNVGKGPTDLAYIAGTGLLYVADNVSNEVSVIDTATGATIGTISAPDVYKLATSPDGSRVYAGVDDGIQVIQSSTGTLLTTIDNGDSSFDDLAVGPDGRLYDDNSIRAQITLRVYDPATFTQLSSNSFPGASNDLAIGTMAPAPAGKADVQAGITGPSSGTTGTAYTYTVTARDAGPGTAVRVGASVLLPSSTTLVSASGSYRKIGRLVVWKTTPDLAPQQSVSYTVTVKFTSRASEILTAGVASLSTPDPKLLNNVAVVTTKIH